MVVVKKSLNQLEEKKLTEQVKKYCVLYDKSHKGYMEKGTANSTWNEIAKIFEFLVNGVCVCVFTSTHLEGFICLGLVVQGTDQRCCVEDVFFLYQVPSSILQYGVIAEMQSAEARQSVPCHWFLSIPPNSIRKPKVF